MDEINKTGMRERTRFRLNEIGKIKDNFNLEINQKKSWCKKLSKYVAAFVYIGKVLIVLSATSDGVSICSLLKRQLE